MWKLITVEGVIFGLEADDGSTYVMLCTQLPRQVVFSFQVLLLVPPCSVALVPEATTMAKLTVLFLESQ